VPPQLAGNASLKEKEMTAMSVFYCDYFKGFLLWIWFSSVCL